MALVFFDFKGGSRFQQGFIYKVSPAEAAALCDEAGPDEITNGLPYARPLDGKQANRLFRFLDEMKLELPVKAPAELGFVAISTRPVQTETDVALAQARTRAEEAESRVAELEGRIEELEAINAGLVVDNEDLVLLLNPERAAAKAELEKLTVDDLKERLKELDLPVAGRKDELVKRLLDVPQTSESEE